MRIAWFTPLSARTGITRYSQSALKALSEKAQIDVWTNDMPDNIPIKCAVVHEATYSTESFNKLETYDAVVYNMGNNIDFHFKIYEFYKWCKGIVILHDKVMHHFNAGYFLERLKWPEGYIALMHYYHGASGKKAAESCLLNPPPVWETEDVIDYPLFQNFLWNASAVIVHSKETLRLIKDRCAGIPSECIYFPFEMDARRSRHIALTKKDLGLPEDKVILLSYGHVTKTKRIDKVLEAVGHNPDIKERVYYIVAGDIQPDLREHVRGLVERYGLKDTVRFTGFVEDDVLTGYIRSADICVNLRYPSTESSSWALAEQLYHGKPVVVTKIGFFDELPDESVVKVDLEDEKKALAGALKRLITDRRYRESVGENGRRFATEAFAPSLYADRFLSFVERVRAEKTRLDCIDRVADEMANFASPDTGDLFSGRVAGELCRFLCDRGPGVADSP